MLKVKAIAAAAVLGLLSAGVATAADTTTTTTITTTDQNCYGVVATGKGEKDAAGMEYVILPAGVCEKLNNGSLEPK